MNQTKYYYLIFIIFTNLFSLSVKSDEIFDKGKKIFLNQGNCSACHILTDANSKGQIGPNLNEIRPDIMRVINAVTYGVGVMPAYEGQLSTEEIKSVAHYVSKSVNQ